jgi:hypothetical protein
MHVFTFRSEAYPGVNGFTTRCSGANLPEDFGPWVLAGQGAFIQAIRCPVCMAAPVPSWPALRGTAITSPEWMSEAHEAPRRGAGLLPRIDRTKLIVCQHPLNGIRHP